MGGETRRGRDPNGHGGTATSRPDDGDAGVDRTSTPPYRASGGEDGRHQNSPAPLGQEAPEVVEDAAIIGEQRLDRSVAGDIVTSFIGGMAICFGLIAMAFAAAAVGGGIDQPSGALLAGALAYPVGFVILLVGKSELFTENFLLPVTGVIEGHGTARQLGSLWAISLAGNLLGVIVFAALVTRGDVLATESSAEIIAAAEHVVAYDLTTTFVKAIFAGWLMTILTWLLLAAEGLGPRLVIIWLIGTLLVLGQFGHVIITAAEIFMAMFLGADISVGTWAGEVFLPTLVGNILGGVIFVTLLQIIQSRVETAEEG